MQGELLVDVSASPATVNFGEIPLGERATESLELEIAEREEPVRISSVEIVDDQDLFELHPVEVEAGEAPRFEVLFRGAKAVGRYSSRIRVKTTGENTPELTVPLIAKVTLNLRYLETHRFGRVRGELQRRVIRISARRGDAPKIEKMVDPHGLLSLELHENEGPMVSIYAKVDEEALAKLPEDERSGPHPLILHTSDRQEPRVELQYFVMPESPTQGRTPGPRVRKAVRRARTPGTSPSGEPAAK